MGSALITVAVFAPLLAAVAVAALRPVGLTAGRIVTVGCGVGSLAGIAALTMSGFEDNGLIGDVAGLGLRVDRASAMLLTVAVATGTVVASFARRNVDVDPRGNRFFVLFGVLVTGSALVVVPGGAIALTAGWLASTWALIGLVGHRNEVASTRRAQRRTALALVIGDAALVIAVLTAVAVAGSDAIRDIGAAVGELESSSVLGASAADIVAILLVIAGASRSALVPFHRWLVSTLAAPTPVSALVHAGFVSAAGLLIIRFGPLVIASFAAAHLAFALGVITVIAALGSGSTRVDVKGKLAWSTAAQMGFMVVQCAVGAFSSAVFHIAGHGMYKASLFLGAGDAVSASLRSSRRTSPLTVGSSAARIVSTLLIATGAVALAMAVIPPDVNNSGVVLIAVFAWLTVAHGVWGWLERGSSRWPRPVIEGALGALVGAFGYIGGLRIVEYFLQPSFGSLSEASSVSTATLVTTLVVIGLLAALWNLVESPAATTVRDALTTVAARTAHPAVSGDLVGRLGHVSTSTASPIAVPTSDVSADPSTRSRIRADIARASNVVAPTWPLTSVVAVNPLGGLEGLGFEAAATVAREQLHARTYLTLEEYQRDHAQGLTSDDDVRWAVRSQFLETCAQDPVRLGNRVVPIAEIIDADMLHSPEPVEATPARTVGERIEGTNGPIGHLIDVSICHSITQFVGRKTSSSIASVPFLQQAHNDAAGVSSVRHLLSASAVAWLRGLDANPASIIAAVFAATGVADDQRVAEMRGHLARLQGWAGYAKWRSEWAHSDEKRPPLALIELVAARSALEAALLMSNAFSDPRTSNRNANDDARTSAIASALGVDDSEARTTIAQVTAQVGPFQRHEAWLRAQERSVDHNLLSTIERFDPDTTPKQADAQLVFCIDVRSEGFRRNLELTGPYDTIGFAGFFGVAMSVRRLEWAAPEARCPVLVAPSLTASERPVSQPDALAAINESLARDRRKGGTTAVATRTKSGLGAPFVMAEAAGWVTGPIAAAKTLLPRRSPASLNKSTIMELERGTDADADLGQRVFIAEAVLRTMGLIHGFAPLVVLCGHTSHNTNNPHATALDCGACAGASGQDNARTVAALLNDAEVRTGLREQGIDIPDGTHFVGALHDTVSDTVEILDRHSIEGSHAQIVERLTADLEVAAARQSARRSEDLPGPMDTVRDRGTDWAQVRPEWGLARNSSFIIGPRSMTAGLDLEGRSFLHTYEADNDPDGKVLETIMTAPMVVAHWISSQYYFSTVDREAFGAGDKLIHNVVADTAVISGESGDLRVGLPSQSTHLGDERHHQAIRLLAVIQAPLERIEQIIQQHPILQTLTAGSWIRIAGRSHPHEPWSLRSPGGTWNTEPQALGISDSTTPNTTIPNNLEQQETS
ncbi:MAG: putative inorganic carbon transporter subunit DabA [Ilumatobacter sp.]